MSKAKKQNIFIVGPLGAGKSTLGRALAKVSHRTFFDTDRIVEERVGVDLSWVFDLEGEEGFARREAQVLSELVKLPNIVLATGGSTLILEKNRQLIKENGLVIYLNIDLEQQYRRTKRNQYNRPLLLRTGNLRKRLQELRDQYTPLFESVADMSFSTEKQSVKSIVNAICRKLN